jgi:hypothetical protein
VTVTIDYSRCRPNRVKKNHPLSVWHIDAATKELLEDMGGTNDPVSRTMTFSTGHFSGYSIAQ